MNRLLVLDSHFHLWRIDAPESTWPDADWPALHRTFAVEDYAAKADGVAFAGGILVQSQPDDRDTDWLLATARTEASVLGVVAWAALDAPNATARIAALAHQPKCLGVRPMLPAIADDKWLLRSQVEPGVAAMVEHQLRFDALVEPPHLPILTAFAKQWPSLRIVVDHAGKPDIANGTIEPWRQDLADLAKLPNVWCKLSGLRTQQRQGQPWAAIEPYAAHVLTCFGDRTMWGSDWPVLLHMEDDFTDWVDAVTRMTDHLGQAVQDRLFHGAAREFYGLG